MYSFKTFGKFLKLERKQLLVVTVHKNELGYHVVHVFLFSVYAESFNISVSLKSVYTHMLHAASVFHCATGTFY